MTGTLWSGARVESGLYCCIKPVPSSSRSCGDKRNRLSKHNIELWRKKTTPLGDYLRSRGKIISNWFFLFYVTSTSEAFFPGAKSPAIYSIVSFLPNQFVGFICRAEKRGMYDLLTWNLLKKPQNWWICNRGKNIKERGKKPRGFSWKLPLLHEAE